MKIEPVTSFKFTFDINGTPYNFTVPAKTEAEALETLQTNLKKCLVGIDEYNK